MPSKYEKERQKAKKEAAKKKGGKKADPAATNGSEEADTKAASNGASKEGTPAAGAAANGATLTYEEELCQKLEDEARLAAEARACTGVLGIHPMARDIKIDNFSVTFYGANLLQDTKLELSVGNR